jgi:hypothetical protein
MPLGRLGFYSRTIQSPERLIRARTDEILPIRCTQRRLNHLIHTCVPCGKRNKGAFVPKGPNRSARGKAMRAVRASPRPGSWFQRIE